LRAGYTVIPVLNIQTPFVKKKTGQLSKATGLFRRYAGPYNEDI
jgi:hypothetical protein